MAVLSNNSRSGASRTPHDQQHRERGRFARKGRILARCLVFVGMVEASSCLAPPVCAKEFEEYRVKAAFLYTFAKFVEWPAPSFKGPDDPIAICVAGQNPFGHMLEDTVSGKTLEGRFFVVRYLPDALQAGGCHILFVSASERKNVGAILESIRTPGVLTVGESEGFAMNGGVINFKLDSGKVRFEINPDAAAKAGLSIRSNLLSLAQIVKKSERDRR
jgi:hypothetical protein